jgi:hypothetical protein
MTHDELIKAILHLLIDLGYYPNNMVGWQQKYAPILSEHLGRKVTRATISQAMSVRCNRRGPVYQQVLNSLYQLLTDEKINPSTGIIHTVGEK